MATKAGDIEVRIPMLRKDSFSLHPRAAPPHRPGARRGRDADLRPRHLNQERGRPSSLRSEPTADLQVRGLPDRRAARRVSGRVLDRALDHVAFPYVHLDATYLHVRNKPGKGGKAVSIAVVVATGIAADGSREVLWLDVGDSEDETFWRSFLLSLKQCGLSGVQLVISDQHSGLVAPLKRFLPRSAHQRPGPLRMQPLGARAKSHAGMVAAAFRTIFAQPDPEAVSKAWDEVRDQLAASFPKVGPLMDQAKTEVLAITGFPGAH